MDNDYFRKMMLANSAKSEGIEEEQASSTSKSTKGAAVSLGSRHRANIPMAPRSIGGTQPNLTRQLAAQTGTETSSKKFKTSAPKGARLASGYVDRAKDRDDDTDNRTEQLKKLEEALKAEEIDQETFERRRFEIAGGDLESTHLIKGLDFKLLERIRKGEDVYGEKQLESSERQDADANGDVDDEFDKLEDQEIQAIAKEKTEKKGQLSTVPAVTGKKRNRNQILAELKAAREAAKAKAEPALGDRFKKIGAKQMPGSRIERDSKGREVLIIIDEDGHEKRKVRKLQPGQEAENNTDVMMPDKNAKTLDMEVPEQYRKAAAPPPEEDEDVDIFDDVGDDYDPLAGMGSSGPDSDSDSDNEKSAANKKAASTSSQDKPAPPGSMLPPPKPGSTLKQNYFKDAKTSLISEQQANKMPSMSDPAILAALKRASALRPLGGDGDGDEDELDDADRQKKKALEEKRRKMLENTDRDADDMDMGFGTSRLEDEEDTSEAQVKFSKWSGKSATDDNDDDTERGGGKGKRKRAPKKRKGDVNNAADVLRVMEQRKKS